MLTQMEARNTAGALLGLTLDDVTDGYILKDVLGLDPAKSTLVSSSFANLPGAQFQSAKTEPRNIIIKIGLEPDYVTTTVRQLRTNLYKYFMPGREVRLRFYDSDGLVVEVTGRVETCQAPLFSKEPQMDISVMCFEPDLVELTPIEVEGDTVSDSTEMLVGYEGSMDAGFIFTLHLDRTLSAFTLYLRPPDNIVRSLEVTFSMLSGDVVTISTVVGDKYAELTRSGVTTSILYGVDSQANWDGMQLQEGDNYIRAYATGAAIPYDLTFTQRHGGM